MGRDSWMGLVGAHLQVGQAAALAVQLLDLVGIADVALVQRRLLGIVGRLQVLEISLVPKFYIAVDADADSYADFGDFCFWLFRLNSFWAEVEVELSWKHTHSEKEKVKY